MFSDTGTFDQLARLHYEDLLREAEQERLAMRVAGPGRPIRSHIAEWLFAAAARLDGQRIAPAEA